MAAGRLQVQSHVDVGDKWKASILYSPSMMVHPAPGNTAWAGGQADRLDGQAGRQRSLSKHAASQYAALDMAGLTMICAEPALTAEAWQPPAAGWASWASAATPALRFYISNSQQRRMSKELRGGKGLSFVCRQRGVTYA